MKVKYELITNLTYNYKVYLAEIVSNYSPAIGSIVNINGDPYIVYKVYAAIVEDGNTTYLYVNVFKAGNFTVKIGGRIY